MLNDAASSLQRETLSTLRCVPWALVLAWLEVPETLCKTSSVVLSRSPLSCLH